MDIKFIKEVATKEIESPSEKSTIELLLKIKLKVHNSQYVIASITEDGYENSHILVLFEVENNRFYFAMYLKNKIPYECDYSSTLPGNDVYLNAISYDKKLNELTEITKLLPSSGWSIYDVIGTRTMDFTSFKINSTLVKTMDINSKLEDIVNFLEQKVDGLAKLNSISKCNIVIATWQHLSHIDGFSIDRKLLKRLALLDIDIDYMQYVFK